MTGRIETFTRDGLVFDVIDEGPIDGDPVVLLHGFPERATCWREVAPLLHAEGYRTLAPDQRGYSPGARPRRRRDHALHHLVDDVAALVEVVGRPVHLVGHDWGAVVGWGVAAKRPELLRSWTGVSVPHLRAFLRATVRSTQLLKSWYIAAFQVPGLAEAVSRRGRMGPLLRRGGMRPDEVERFEREMVADGAVRGGLMWYRALVFRDPAAQGPVRVPTTFVWSDGDDFVGRKGGQLTPAHVEADYQYVELQGVTHWVPTQAPEALATAVLERIRSVEPGGRAAPRERAG